MLLGLKLRRGMTGSFGKALVMTRRKMSIARAAKCSDARDRSCCANRAQ